MYSDITGVILSGGKSSRMGTNKALLKLGNTTVIERAVNLITPLFPKIFLSTNSPEEYSFLQLPFLQDEQKGIGPVAGIYAGLKHAETEKVFIISCDIPLMTRDVIEFLCEYNSSSPILISTADGFIQPLCGLYNRSLLPALTAFIRKHEQIEPHGKNNCKLLSLIKSVPTEIVDIQAVYPAYQEGTFFNMNNKIEFEEIQLRFTENII